MLIKKGIKIRICSSIVKETRYLGQDPTFTEVLHQHLQALHCTLRLGDHCPWG